MASQNRGKMRKQEFVILKDRASGQITNVIAPNGLQIGLNDEEFQTNLVLNGPVVANDGTSWLVAGDNVTLSTGSNNAVTISANAGSAYAELTGGGAEYGIKTFTYDGTSAVVVKVDLDTIYGGLDFSTYGLAVTPSALDVAFGATPEDDDLLIIEDVSQSSLKTRKITVANLMAAASSLSSLGNPLSFGDGIESSTGNDYDNTANTEIRVKAGSGTGVSVQSGYVKVNVYDSGLDTVDAENEDYILIADDSDSKALKKVTIQTISDLATVGQTTNALTDGNGITDFSFDGASADITVSVEAADSTINVASSGISVASVPNTLDAGDGITTFSYDGGTSSITVSVDLDADGGLGINSSELAIDYSTLTTAGITTSDYLSFYDIDRDPNTSKINLGDFVDFLQGAIDWSLNSGDPNAEYLVLAATASLSAERVLTPSNGLTATDAGAGNSYTLGIDYSGGGNLISAASDGTGISVDGSNDKLLLYDNDDATVKYITANQIAGTAYTAGDGLDLSSYEFSADLKSGGGLKIDTTEIAVDDSVVATLTGSQFSGNVGITGSLGATSFLLVGTPSGPHSIQIDAGGLTSGSIAFSKSGGDPDAAISLNSNEHLELSSLLSNKDIIFSVNDNSVETEVMRVDGSHSSVAIGVNSNTTSKFKIKVTDGDNVDAIDIDMDDPDQKAIDIDSEGIGIEVNAKKGLYVNSDVAGGYGGFFVRNQEAADTSDPLVTIRDQDGDKPALKVIQESKDTAAFAIEAGNIGGTKTTVSGSGQVGIGTGTSTYDAILHVKGIERGDGIVLEDADSSDTVVKIYESTDDGVIDVYANNSVTARIHGNGDSYFDGGNVGIGITEPGTKLDVGGNIFSSGFVTASLGFSGSLTKLIDGTSFLVAGTGISIATGSKGQVTITNDGSTGEITGVIAGTGLTGGGLSGTVTLNVDNSVVATLTGSQFSGNVGVTGSLGVVAGISGSLTHLVDGTSYLIAGSNVTIATGSSGAVTIAAGGGDISIVSGSSTVSNVTTLNLSNLGIVNDLGSGTVAITGSIGDAEDGTYVDGLFVDFNTTTPVGTAVDRFNEVLKALSPAPAPDLDNINAAETGVFSKLSFGAASSVGGYTNVGSSAGYGSAVDVNGSYQVATASSNIRMATFAGSTAVTGTLNSDVSPSNYSNGNTNYTTSSFGDGDQGVLRLMVNGSNIKEIDLTVGSIGAGTPGSGTGTYVNANGSGFIVLSQTGSAVFEDASTLAFFQHRTGQYTVSTDDQRDGWNYIRVLHVLTGSTKQTNYMEWVNDSNNDALAASNETIDSFDLGDGLYLSGIQYYISGTASYKVDVSNAYRNVYSGSVSFNTSDCSVSSQVIPALNTGAGETSLSVLKVTGSAEITATTLLNAGITVSTDVTHPLKSNLSGGGSVTSDGVLLYTASNDSTVLLESFKRENYRITSASYDTQASVTAGAATWDSMLHLSGAADQTDGLIFYNQKLYTPTNSLLSGDFRNSSDGGSITYAPTANPDYSGLTSGTKTFYRYFQNTSGDITRDISIDIDGSGTIVQQGTANNTTRLSLLFKLPDTGVYQTGWLDLTQDFVTGSYSDGDGCLVGSLDSSLDAVNIATFGTQSIGSNEYITMKIEADAAWTGNVDDITVSFGAGTGIAPSEAPALDDIDCDDSGTAVKLSFGSSQAISGYADVGTAAGFSAVDVNGNYIQTNSGNNLRRAVFDGSTVIDGTLNEDVSSNGSSYVANAFNSGAFGSIKLEVNGAIVRTVDLVSFGAGNSLNANDSGFTGVLAGTPGEYSGNSVPDYTLIYRTGTYQVGTSDQRDGWNYARVIHSVGGSDTETNYVEWVNDPNSDALTTGNETFDNFGSDATLFYQSGVKYFITCTSSFAYSGSNVYKNVYSRSSTAVTSPTRDNISVTQIAVNGSGVSNSTNANYYSSLPNLDTAVADCEQQDINVTGSITFGESTSLVGPYGTGYYTASISGRVSHPMKSNVTTDTSDKANFLVFSASQNSTLYTLEYFDDENYRLQSGSFANQASLAGSGWDPSISMNDAGETPYYDGLLIYNGYLVSPKTGAMGDGDFRSVRDGGSLQAPDSNVNYSSLGLEERNYTRYFENNTTNDVPQINLMLTGSATLVARNGPNSGVLGANNNFHCAVKIPGKTGWFDLARASAGAGNISNDDGGLSGDLTAAITSDGVLNICTFNGQTQDGTTSGAEYVLVRFTTHENWTGKISAFKVGY